MAPPMTAVDAAVVVSSIEAYRLGTKIRRYFEYEEEDTNEEDPADEGDGGSTSTGSWYVGRIITDVPR